MGAFDFVEHFSDLSGSFRQVEYLKRVRELVLEFPERLSLRRAVHLQHTKKNGTRATVDNGARGRAGGGGGRGGQGRIKL